MKPAFGVTFKSKSGEKTLCLVALSDAYRRAASFDRPQLAKAFNKQARMLCAAAQYWDFTLPAHCPREHWPIDKAVKAFEKIIALAEDEKIERIILPVYEDSEPGRFLKKAILDKYDGNIEVELQEHPYMTRLQHLGAVRKGRKTAFDYGMAYVVG